MLSPILPWCSPLVTSVPNRRGVRRAGMKSCYPRAAEKSRLKHRPEAADGVGAMTFELVVDEDECPLDLWGE